MWWPTPCTAGILANRKKLTWRTKEGEKTSNYFGSVTQASTVQIGTEASGAAVHVPMKNLMPMVNPNDLVIGGWDISSMNLGEAMRRSAVLDVNLQDQLYDEMAAYTPMPSIYFPDFIAANQTERADNVLTGTKREQMDEAALARHAAGGSMSHADAPAAQLTLHADSRASGRNMRSLR